MQSLLQKYAAKKRWAGHQKRLLRFRRSRTDSAAEQAKEAGVGHAQDQKQGDERKQHPDDDVHLMDGEGKMIVELFLGIDKVLVAVVKQGLFALFKVGPLIGKLGLLLCQLCFAGSQNGFAPGKLCLALGRGEVFLCHTAPPDGCCFYDSTQT